MKEYQRLRYEYEPKITGIQSGGSAAWFEKSLLHHNTDFIEWFGEGAIFMTPLVPATEAMVLHFQLDKKAKFTDFLQVSLGRGFVVNDRVRNLLTDFKLPPHKYYKVIFHEEKTNLVIDKGYWWLCYELLTGEHGEVNFAKSEFWESVIVAYRNRPSIHKKKIESMDKGLIIPTYEAYMAAFEANKKCYPAKKMVLTSSFKKFDIWSDRLLSISDYISTDLVEAFKSNKITGFKALETDCELIFE
jgi:hypothetical protein